MTCKANTATKCLHFGMVEPKSHARSAMTAQDDTRRSYYNVTLETRSVERVHYVLWILSVLCTSRMTATFSLRMTVRIWRAFYIKSFALLDQLENFLIESFLYSDFCVACQRRVEYRVRGLLHRHVSGKVPQCGTGKVHVPV